MAQSQRVRRVNESVKEILAEALRQVKDPRIGFVTITDVRTTTDLKHCEVFYTVLPDDPDTRQRNTPDLQFTHDPVPEQGRRIERLLREEAERGSDHGDQ
jgi:ribosome-binding factor A